MTFTAGLALGVWLLGLAGLPRPEWVGLVSGGLALGLRRVLIPPPTLPPRDTSVLGALAVAGKLAGFSILFVSFVRERGVGSGVHLPLALALLLFGDWLDRSLRFAAALAAHDGSARPPRRWLPIKVRMAGLVVAFTGAAFTALWLLIPGQSAARALIAIGLAGACFTGVWALLREEAFTRDWKHREEWRRLRGH